MAPPYTYTNKNTKDTVVSPQARPRLDFLPNWERSGEADPLPKKSAKGKTAPPAKAPEDGDAYPAPSATAPKPKWIDFWVNHPDEDLRLTEDDAKALTHNQLAARLDEVSGDGESEG